MKKAILKQIKAAASNLPQTFTRTRTVVKGEEVIRKVKGEPKDENGKPLDPEKDYLVPARRLVNHESALKRAYQSGGMAAMENYCREVLATAGELTAEPIH